MSETIKKKQPNPGQMNPIYQWDAKRENLIVKEYEDLDEVMIERARGVSIYDMIEKYGAVDLIPGFGAQTVKRSGSPDEPLNQCDLDLTGVPEFSTDVYNAQLAAAEARLSEELKKAEEAKKAAAEAEKAAAEAAKAKQEAIDKLLKQGGNSNE